MIWVPVAPGESMSAITFPMVPVPMMLMVVIAGPSGSGC